MENTRFTDLFEVLLEGMFETILASQHLSFSCTFRLFKSRVERRLYSLKPISMMQFHKCEMFIIFVEIMSKRCSALSMLKDHRLMSETVSLWPLNSNVYGVVLWLLQTFLLYMRRVFGPIPFLQFLTFSPVLECFQ
jgi:hypothetical protein